MLGIIILCSTWALWALILTIAALFPNILNGYGGRAMMSIFVLGFFTGIAGILMAIAEFFVWIVGMIF